MIGSKSANHSLEAGLRSLQLENPNWRAFGSQSGFTLIECLIAILVVSILMTAIAPVIFLSVGNRVQARRVELATQAAREYVDGVASGVIQPPLHAIELDEVDDNNNFTAQRATFAGAFPPSTTGSLACPTNTTGNYYCWNTITSSLYCIDIDRNGCSSNSVQDFVVQGFRSITPRSKNSDNRSYLLGVRVYRTDAFSDNAPLVKSDPETRRIQATSAGGISDRKAPLVEMTTEVTTQKATMQDFCDRLSCK